MKSLLLHHHTSVPREETLADNTHGLALMTVFIGVPLVVGNVVDLGGTGSSAREWTAWMMALLVVVHGVSLAWKWRDEDSEIRIPRWLVWSLPFVFLFGLAWVFDRTSPEQSGQNFFLALEAWLLCWVVAATPGGRSLSWAWIMVVATAATMALLAAIGWQVPSGGLWLPLNHELPAAWQGSWSGTLPSPAAFGALMLLAGIPLMAMAWSGHLPLGWRMLCTALGTGMMLGIFKSRALGVWCGGAWALAVMPAVVASTRGGKIAGWLAFAVGGGIAIFLPHFVLSKYEPNFAPTAALGAPLDASVAGLREAWNHSSWLGGEGRSLADLLSEAEFVQPEGGWSYGFSDWLDLTTAWGALGLSLALLAVGGLVAAAWGAWARLPHDVSAWVGNDAESEKTGRKAVQATTPEAKVILVSGALGVSAFAVAMMASRTLQYPGVVFAFAIVAGVLARNVPQRGGVTRLDSVTRPAICIGTSFFTAVFFIVTVVPANVAQMRLKSAHALLALADERPDAELLNEADVDLHDALTTNQDSGSVLTERAWLWLEWARLDPAQFTRYSQLAEADATRAADYTPDSPEPWIARGLACLLANRGGDAARHISHALELAPYAPKAQYYASLILLGERAPQNGPPIPRLLPPRNLPPKAWPPLEGVPAQMEFSR